MLNILFELDMNESIIYLIGITGNLLFGFKSAFQVLDCYKRKSCSGISKWMLLADFFGNLACAMFIHLTTGFRLWPQFVNYGFATLFLIILFIMMIIYKGNK